MDVRCTRRGFLQAAGATALASGLSRADDEPAKPPRHSAPVAEFLGGLYAERQQKLTFHPQYPGGFEAWQAEFRPVLRGLVGLDAIARHVGDHKPVIELGEPKARGNHTLQHGTIETEPGVRNPFWLLKPAGRGPFPLAILPHGHDRQGHDTYAGVYHTDADRARALAQDRDVAVQAVERGFVAIAPSIRGLADEAAGVPDAFDRHGRRNCRSQFMHAILAGRTAVGERVWDMMRLIDYATTRSEVDASDLLMMGNSGGGVVTIYAAALDTRVTIAVPSCSFSVIASRRGRIYHCDCCAIPGILNAGELYDVAGLTAPRHFLAVNGRKDKLHTAEDIERSAQRVAAIYKAAGVPERFAHKWGAEGHQFYKDLMWPFVKRAMEA